MGKSINMEENELYQFKGIKSSFIVFIATILLIAQSGMYSIPTVFADNLSNGVTITAIDEEGEYVVETEAVSFDEGDTAFDVLDEIAEVDYDETEFGPYITGINELTPEDGYSWGFFVNGSSSDTGADGYDLDNGDNLLFKVVDEDILPHATIDVAVSAVDLDGEEVLPETTIDIVEGGTAYDALVQAATENEVSLDVTVDSELLTYINNLDDRLDDSAYWGMYLNDDYMNTGLVGYQMQEGDHLALIAEWIDGENTEEEQNNDDDSGEKSTNEEQKSEPQSTNLQELTLESIEKSTEYLVSNNNLGWYGFIAMNTLDKEVSQQVAGNSVESVISNEGDYTNVTDTARNILVLTAAGKDATDIEGYNLVEKLINHERMTSQGNNGPIYSLLAINSGNYETAADATWTRDVLIEFLLDEQLDEGGWALYGTAPSADLTGMALTALAPYQEDEDVQKAIDHAVNYLSNRFVEEGGYPDPWHGGDSSPSVAMALIGLVSVGIDPVSTELTTEEGINIVQRLLHFQNEDGGFGQNDDAVSNGPASNQGLLGLAAYYKYLNNDGLVFDFSITDKEEPPGKGEEKPKEEETAEKTEKIIEPETITNDKKKMSTHIVLDDVTDIEENIVIVQPDNAIDQLIFDVELSNEALEKLVQTNSDLKIDKGDVNLLIPTEVLQQILEESDGESVNIKLEKYEANNALGPVYDITITAGDKTISSFNGEITLNFQVDQDSAANVDPAKIKLFYFNEETKEWEVIENSVFDPETGLVTAETAHFSIFGVFESDTTANVIPTVAEVTDEDETGENGDDSKDEDEAGAAGTDTGNKLPNTATNLFNMMLIGLSFMVIGGILWFVRSRRHA